MKNAKKKTKFLAALMSAVIMTKPFTAMALPPVNYAPDRSYGISDDASDYVGIIEDYFEKYGEPTVMEDKYGFTFSGAEADLIDFDNDGCSELLMDYELHYDIYSARNGTPELIFSMPANSCADESHPIMRGKDGKAYIVSMSIDFETGSSKSGSMVIYGYTYDFYGYKDGKFQKIHQSYVVSSITESATQEEVQKAYDAIAKRGYELDGYDYYNELIGPNNENENNRDRSIHKVKFGRNDDDSWEVMRKNMSYIGREYVYYTDQNGDACLVSYLGNEKEVVVPQTIEGKKVVYLSGAKEEKAESDDRMDSRVTGVFENNTGLQKVIIPGSVNGIGADAFNNCPELSEVIIGDGVRKIENHAFRDCRLESITIPESVIIIDDDAISMSDEFADKNKNTLTIYGYKGSEAQRYAKFKGLKFAEASDEAFIVEGPFALTLEYEKNDDEKSDIILNITNNGSIAAENISAELYFDNKKLPAKTVKSIDAGKTEEVRWTLEEDTASSYSRIAEATVRSEHSIEYKARKTIVSDSLTKEKTLDFERDIWKFTNKASDFPKERYMSKRFLDEKNLHYNNITIENLYRKLNASDNKDWNGACFGMSATVVLAKMGLINISDYDNNASCLHDADTPAKNSDVCSLIEYYQNAQDDFRVADEQAAFSLKSTYQKMKYIINQLNEVKNGGAPVVIGIHFNKKNYTENDKKNKKLPEKMHHELAAYDIQELDKPKDIKNMVTDQKDSYAYKITMYDCSQLSDKKIYMYITDDLSRWIIPEYCQSKMTQKKDDIIEYKNEGDIDTVPLASFDGSRYKELVFRYGADLDTNNNTYLLVNANGVSYRLSDLLDHTDNSEEIVPHYISDKSDEDEEEPLVSDAYAKFFITDAGDGITVSDAEGGTAEADYTINYANSMIIAEASAAKSVRFGRDSVSLDADKSDYRISMTFNEGNYDLPWFNLTAKGDHADNVRLEQVKYGVIFSSDNMKNISLSAHNMEEKAELSFSSDAQEVFITSEDNTLKVFEDPDNDGVYDKLLCSEKAAKWSMFPAEIINDNSKDSSNTDSNDYMIIIIAAAAVIILLSAAGIIIAVIAIKKRK